MPVYLSPPPRSPLARAAAAIVGALVLVGAFMVGMVAFVVLLGVGLIGGAWFWFRTRDLRRALAEAAEAQAAGMNPGMNSGMDPGMNAGIHPGMNTKTTRARGDVIEAEYSVVTGDGTSTGAEAASDPEEHTEGHTEDTTASPRSGG